MRFCSSVMVLMPSLYAAGALCTRYVPLRDTLARERSRRRAAAPLAHAVECHGHHDEGAHERALPPGLTVSAHRRSIGPLSRPSDRPALAPRCGVLATFVILIP